MTGGAVAEDFDGDGRIDLYVLHGGQEKNLMYMNQGGGRFADEAGARGTALRGDFSGACGADYDNDGDIDLCVTRLLSNPLLLINDGAGNFTTDAVMLPEPSWNVMSPSWGDVDNDGLLELVIGQWNTELENLYLYRNTGLRLEAYEFRSNSVTDRHVFSPGFADVNNDRLADLLVVADFDQSQLYLNRGAGRFERVTAHHGTGTDQNGMGSAVADYDNDGDLDWFVSSIRDSVSVPEGVWGTSGNRLYQNHGDGTFVDATDEAGVRDGNWGWGSGFGDFDNDGNLDLFHVNGWPETFLPTITERFNDQPARLFMNMGGGRFFEEAASAGVADRGQGRGTILFDYDDDGDLDIFIANNQELNNDGPEPIRDPGRPVLLRNDSVTSNHWLKVILEGRPPLHRHGIGSRVYLTQGSRTQMRELHASTGFLAHGPGRIAHFGLGRSATADELRAEWVNGDAVLLEGVAADQTITLRSPSAVLSKRSFVVGEEVLVAAGQDGPGCDACHWEVENQAYADPLRLWFRSPGRKELRLRRSAAEGAGPLPDEIIRINVRPFAIQGMGVDPGGSTVTIAWEGFAGRTYQVESCSDLQTSVWRLTGAELNAETSGVLSATVPRDEEAAFYRVMLVE